MPFFRRKLLLPPTGYVRRKDAIRDFIANTSKPFLSQQNAEIKGSGEGVQVRLMLAYEKVTGVPFVPHKQIHGTCVGEGGVLGAELLSAVEIAAGQKEVWRGKFCVAYSYGISRVEVGGGRIRGDGSTGAWMAKALMHYGVLLNRRYPKYDLSTRRDDLAVRWGDMGVPDELEVIGKERPVETAALVTSAAEAADSIANGNPVFMCANWIFNQQQLDKDGFSNGGVRSGHCTLLTGVDTKSERRGFENQGSWGEFYRGPKHKLGCAAGACWNDWAIIDKLLRQNDSFALSGFVGYPRRKIDYVLL